MLVFLLIIKAFVFPPRKLLTYYLIFEKKIEALKYVRKKGLELLKCVAKQIKGCKEFDRVLDNVKIISGGDGCCCCEFNVAQEHLNLGGGLHGGMSATLVDVISSYGLATLGKPIGVSVDIHVSYLKSAICNDPIVVNARTIRTGRSLAFLHVDICNKKTGELLVTGTHTKYVGNKKASSHGNLIETQN